MDRQREVARAVLLKDQLVNTCQIQMEVFSKWTPEQRVPLVDVEKDAGCPRISIFLQPTGLAGVNF